MIEVATGLKFRRQPSPVLAEHRPIYKICQLLLVLHISSRASRSRLPRLHLFNWALRSPERIEQLTRAAAEKVLRVRAWGFDPALAIAVRFAIAEGLVHEASNAYELTDSGMSLVKDILKNRDLFLSDKNALNAIGKGITEGMVDNVAKGWEAE